LYASGLTLEEIATQKFLATNTVRKTLRVARERVGAKSLTHLAVLCVEAGVIYKNGHGFKPLQVDGVVSE
jgi:DNA-binding CsgD family transcriptional regulator